MPKTPDLVKKSSAGNTGRST